MKRFLALILAFMLVLSGCGEEPVPTGSTEPSTTQSMEVQPTPPASEPTECQTDWSQYSDYELMEMTLKSDANAYKHNSPIYMLSRQWLIYMMEHCEPFKELMFRETALQSMKEHTLELLTQYRDEKAGMLAKSFAELVVTLLPEMQEELSEFCDATSEIVTTLPTN